MVCILTSNYGGKIQRSDISKDYCLKLHQKCFLKTLPCPPPYLEIFMSSTVKAQTVCLIKSKTAALSIRILGSIGSRLKVVYIQSQCLSYQFSPRCFKFQLLRLTVINCEITSKKRFFPIFKNYKVSIAILTQVIDLVNQVKCDCVTIHAAEMAVLFVNISRWEIIFVAPRQEGNSKFVKN